MPFDDAVIPELGWCRIRASAVAPHSDASVELGIVPEDAAIVFYSYGILCICTGYGGASNENRRKYPTRTMDFALLFDDSQRNSSTNRQKPIQRKFGESAVSFTVRNHYVPQWYQRRFLDKAARQSKLWYLDLKPEPIRRPDGTSTTRTPLRSLGPVNCFQQEHLYTLFFGNRASDVIEKDFFGVIDANGEKAVSFFENYTYHDEAHEAFDGMRNYLAAQLFRTPKGLALLQRLARTSDQQRTLLVMNKTWRIYQTIWTEAIWEVISCTQSPTKFLISDSPVTTYNRAVFPESPEVRQFGMARFEWLGTHALFPLDKNHCLVITNLQLVRNPKANPLRVRENPRYFGDTAFDLRKVQRGREVDEATVIAINHVLKTHAYRYIASPNKDDLYPELHVRPRHWSKIGGAYFLMPDPRKVTFTTAIIFGNDDGKAWGTNEYGHFDLDGPKAKKLRDTEWRTFQQHKQAWDDMDRRAGREPPNVSEYWL